VEGLPGSVSGETRSENLLLLPDHHTHDAVDTQVLCGLSDDALAKYCLVDVITGLVSGAHYHSAGVICQVLKSQDWREHKVYQWSSANKSVWCPYGVIIWVSRRYVAVAELEQLECTE